MSRSKPAKRDLPAEKANPAAKRPPGRPRKISPEELRERVLEAATTVFVEVGLAAASSDRIAELSGIPRPTIHRMFGSKREVFEAAVERGISRILDNQIQSWSHATHRHGRDVASVTVRAFLELVAREPAIFRILQLAEHSGSPKTRDAIRFNRQRLEERTALYIQQTWEGRRPLTDREARLATRLTHAILEAGAGDLFEHGDFDVDELVEFLTDFIRTGFTTLRTADPD